MSSSSYARSAYKTEPDVDFKPTYEDVRAAKCQDPTACTLALAGQRAVGQPVRVVYDELTGQVSIAWHEPLANGRVRLHRGVLEPVAQATRLLLMTDANKSKFMRQLRDRGEREFSLTITQHVTRYSQPRPRSQEDKDAEKARAQELKEQRAAGLIPPPVRRASPKVSRGGGTRVLGLISAKP
jgi:hypothetical protein